jgi:hypothetical protein
MNHPRRGQGGQALVIMVIAILAIVAGMGLIIDGGNAWAQQRMTQAGNDAAAEAGAVVLARMYAGEPDPGSWDAEVASQVTSTADANAIDLTAAYYTDICGTLLKADGTKAAGTGDAAAVGGGVLPTNNHTNPDCPSGVVGPVAGVQAQGHKLFDSFVSRVIGIGQLNANTTATAVMGLLQGTCDAASGCVVLPVTAPVTVVSCDKTGEADVTDVDWPMNTPVTVPLCKNNPGNVGWIDWDPKAGGTSELINSILHPDNPPIDLPSWQYVTSTGDVNSKGVEDAINSYAGQVVLFPMFDLTCGSDPDFSQVKVAPDYGCGDIGGNGTNQWYRFPRFAGFLLDHAYINGSNKPQCDTGNGATSCLKGQFVHFVTSGTVGPGVGGGTDEGGVLGVQLIK